MSGVRDRDPGAVVAGMFPPGEYSPQHTVAAAQMAGELVRYLNHATREAEALGDPVDAERVVGALAEAVGRLPQALGQVAAGVRRQATDPQLRADGLGPVPADGARGLADDAAGRLQTAADGCAAAGGALGQARQRLSRLYLDEPADACCDADGW